MSESNPVLHDLARAIVAELLNTNSIPSDPAAHEARVEVVERVLARRLTPPTHARREQRFGGRGR